TYQWTLDGTAIGGATNATYLVKEGDETHTIGVVATVTNDDGLTTTSNDATTAVTDTAPSFATAVAISGTAQEGQTLTASAVSGEADDPVTYQWTLDGTAIGGATNATYLVKEGDETHTIGVVATV